MNPTQYQLRENIQQWLMRPVRKSSVRLAGDLPIALATDIGLVRNENQDRLAVMRVNSRFGGFVLSALCDGMGGMAAGGLCASITLSSFFATCIRLRDKPARQKLIAAAQTANETIFSEFRGNGGATLSVILIDEKGEAFGLNVGDSRVYGSVGTKIIQLSTDDTLAGQLDGDRNRGHHLRNDLLQYIGIGESLEPHILDIANPTGFSKYLITSDGVHYIHHETLETVFSNSENSVEAVSRLKVLSNWCGGRDNASSIAIAPGSVYSAEKPGVSAGLIELWDPEGELRIVSVDRRGSGELGVAEQVEDLANSSTNGHVTGDDNKNANKQKKANPKKRKRRKNPQKKPANNKGDGNNESETVGKPLLKIDFEDSDED